MNGGGGQGQEGEQQNGSLDALKRPDSLPPATLPSVLSTCHLLSFSPRGETCIQGALSWGLLGVESMQMKREEEEGPSLPSPDKLARVFIADFVKRVQNLILFTPQFVLPVVVTFFSEGFWGGSVQVQEPRGLGFVFLPPYKTSLTQKAKHRSDQNPNLAAS